ncbi:MAG: hypothetical protein H6710_05360 [Myxococcales bacterium]|nr:hypothetical protein [Myxococcales bacterium]
MSDLDRLLLGRRLVVCVGPGGVGKTTVAAALALRAAQLGRRTLVLTIDPARRLAASARPRRASATRAPGAGRRARRPGAAPRGDARERQRLRRADRPDRRRPRAPRPDPRQPGLPDHVARLRHLPCLRGDGAPPRRGGERRLRPHRPRHPADPQRPRHPRRAGSPPRLPRRADRRLAPP